MHYSEIKYCDIANGPGIRTSLFVSGCRRHCKNCFNSMTWDFSFGKPFSPEMIKTIYKSLEPDYVDGLTILGGEPMEPENQQALLPFLKETKRLFPKKTIWLYSGNTWEELTEGIAHHNVTDELLRCIDVLVDGPFIEEQKDITLRFRGSANQRILDVSASLSAKCPILWSDDPLFATHSIR